MKKLFALLIGCMCSFSLYAQNQQTLSIIKPDAVAANHIGAIVERFENAGLKVVAARMTRLNREQAEAFYGVHKDRPFFSELVNFMISGPIFVQVLEGPDAVALNRKLMGATNPANADAGTIRADFATDVQHNAVHGSDSLENAQKEIAFFFKKNEIYSR